MIKNSIDYIYDSENVYNLSEYSSEEVDVFIDSMTHGQLEKIQEFFTTMPKLSHTVKWKCEKCGVVEEIVIEGLFKFFYLMLSHNSLQNYYVLSFQLLKHHNWALTEIENLIPWEREIYVTQLMKWLEEEEKRTK